MLHERLWSRSGFSLRTALVGQSQIAWDDFDSNVPRRLATAAAKPTDN